MAKTIIIIEDLDLDNGTVSTSVTTESTALDDGDVTASALYGAFIAERMKDEEFLAQFWQFAARMMHNPAGEVAVDTPVLYAAA